MHINSPLQFLTLLSSNRTKLNDEDGWLASTLIAMTLSRYSDSEAFASTILTALRGHSRFAGVSRLCIVQRVGISNQLQVVSVASNGPQSNTMPLLYSCFVDPVGSLGDLYSGQVRFYSNVNSVIESFKSRGAPVQRSIGRIAKMGYGSGLCAPLFIANRSRGFLFMNWDGPIELQADPSEHLLLSCIVAVSRLFLGDRPKLSSTYFETASRSPHYYVGSTFSHETLQDVIETQLLALGTICPAVRVRGSLGASLVSHGNVGQIFARFISLFGGLAENLDIGVTKNRENNSFFLQGPSLPKEKFNSSFCKVIQDDAKILGMKVTLNPNSLLVETPYDGTTTESYSIESEDLPISVN